MSNNGDYKRTKLASLSEARQGVYAFLSSAFDKPPSSESLAALRDKLFVSSAPDLFSEQTAAPLRQYAEAVEHTAELERQAHQEFTSLFKVPGGQYITPYESVFRDTHDVAGKRVDGLLMGQSAVDVRKWYKLAALDISEEYKDLPDHICLELSYLANLCGTEMEFAGAGTDPKLTRAWEMERDFLAAHVVSWIDALRDKLYDKSQHTYFRAIADLAVEFTKRDLATLEGLLGPSKGTSAPHYDEAAT